VLDIYSRLSLIWRYSYCLVFQGATSAVLAGQGVAMVPRIYVEKELNQGLLVAPWPDAEQLSKTFCLVKPVETGINEPALQDFERWLQAEPMRVT
ncbi:LysR substrate-binding domain-containing protein, partial [Raoultella planticola]|uniref:LysR substrate-binding domain-containing protein n=1 Tax=Raoultella planticola TaxID=575 RepID=UPI003850DF63